MAEEKFYYKFLISSIDFREGLDKIILQEINSVFRELDDLEYTITVIPIQRFGFHDRVDFILECRKPSLQICDLIVKYGAERVKNT